MKNKINRVPDPISTSFQYSETGCGTFIICVITTSILLFQSTLLQNCSNPELLNYTHFYSAVPLVCLMNSDLLMQHKWWFPGSNKGEVFEVKLF